MKQKIYFLCALLFSIASFAQTFNFSGITYSITSTTPPEIKVEGQVAVATGTLPVEISIPTSATYNGLAYTVTSIEHEAFQLSELTKVTLPNTITTIGIRAFSQCYYLNTINIPEKTTVIDFEAFNQCYSLTTMNISENVTLIRDRAFYKCGALTDVSFPNSSLTIGLSAFEYCDRLQTINFGTSVTNIGSNAFKSCIALRNLKIPKSVTSIGNGAFENCNLSLVEVDWAAPLVINATVFQDGLNRITSTLIVPQGKKSTYEAATGWNAFWTIRDRVDVGQQIKIDGINYSFTGVTAPLTVTVNNDNRLFTGNAVIPDSIVHQGIDYQVTSISDGAFAGGAVQSISIGGSSLKTINNSAFNNCLALTHISLGAQVDNIGSNAFSNCLSLRSVNVNWAIPLTIDATVFQNVNLNNVQLNVPQGKASLYGTATVWSTFNPIVAPPTVGEIFIANGINYIVTKDTTPYEVAVGNNLSFIGAANIPASFTYHGFGFGVTSISASAFNSASNLTAVTIPTSIISFGTNAFANCSNLKSVSINWATPLAINTTIFQNVNLNNAQLNVPKGKAYLYRAAAVWGNFNPIAAPPTVDETLTVNGINYIVTKDTTPYEVAVYNNSSFSGAANIPASLSYTGFTFGVTSINASAFSGASGLTTATIPNTVTSIPNNVFSNCTSLTSITIPNSVRSIGSAAFTNCSRLTAISIPNSVTSVANDLFSGCSALTTVAIPESVTSIGNNSFSNCNGLTSVTIPASVTSIGSGAFTNCTRLSSITIPIMVNSIGQNAFSGCTGLTAFTVNWTTPLVINPNVFQFVNLSNVLLHVPSRTSALYEANTVWTNFNIVRPPSPAATHLNFDGVDDAVILPTSIGTALSSGTEFTIEYWYKGNNLQSGVRFQQNGAYIVAGLATSGDPVFAISTDNNPTSITCGPASTINDNTWHHLAFVWKQNERFSTYLDGEVQSETGDSIVLLPYFENVNGSIGAWLEGNTEFLAGNIDDVRIWNVARSGSEIARDRFCELLGYEAGLLAYYKFNQGNDADSNTDVTALTDASSNNNHATLSGGFALIGTNSNFLEGSVVTTGSIVPSPPAISSRLFNMAATVANLPSTVRWYYDAFGGTALPTNTLLETRSYYAAAVNSSGCESVRTEVPVTIYQVTLGETITISGVNYVVTKDTVPYEVEVGDNRFYSDESELFIPPSIYYNGLDFAVTSIANSAFYYVQGLNAVTIPASVSSIGQAAFTYCSALTTVTVNWPTPLIIDTFIFGGLDLKTVQLYVPFGKEALYADAEVWRDFKFPAPALGATFTVNGINYKVTKATLPYEVEVGINGDTTKYDSVAGNFVGAANIPVSVKNLGNEFEVTSIGEIAFLDCNNLTSVSIPNSVRSIGDSAFLGCSGLTSLVLPSSVTTIGQSAFVFCIMLTSVTIPNSVTSIGQNAFAICTGLTAVNVNWTTPLPIAANVFANVTLSNVTLNAPADKVTLYQAADVWKNFNIKLPVPATHLNFDGIDDYVVLPLNKTLIPSSNFTHEFWFQTTDSNGTLFTASTGEYSNPSGWDRSIYMDNGKVSTHLWTGAVNKLTTTASYNDGSWHHVAHVVNAIGSYLYLDGLLAGSNAVTASAFTSNTEITLGVSPLAGGSYFNGNIDDVRIWNVSKTATELARSKNCELIGNETGLVAYYKFNQGYNAESNSTLTTVTNAAANANHGTLTGFGLAGNTSNFSAGSVVTSGLTLPNAPIATAISFCGASTVANLSPAPSPTISWYNVATGGTLLPGLTPISTSGTYYVAALNSNGCESARTSVAVTINSTAAPTASAQSFCNAATVASLTATGANLKWYDAATAGTLLNASTALATGTYFVSQTLNSCESARTSVAVTVNTTAAPTASAQSFCNAATIASLTATGANLKWYDAATAGTLLNASTALATGTYFVSQTLNSCESERTAVAVTVNTTLAPIANQSGAANGDINVNINTPSCSVMSGLYTNDGIVNGKNSYIGTTENPTLRILFNGSKWVLRYLNSTTEYENTTVPSGLFPPIVGWTINGGNAWGCTGTMTIDLPQSSTAVCAGATIANLTATGTDLKWYSTETGGTALETTTALATGTYYVSQSLNSCESARTSVAVTVNSAGAPTASAQSFCNAATVASLTATGANLKWYDAATAGTLLNASTALATGTYFVSQTLNSCESARTSVAVTVNTTAAPTASAQSFCNAVTVASLTATGTNLKWYDAATAGTLLNASAALGTGTYFVSQTLNSCESARTSVAVTINTTAVPTASAQSFCNSSTVASLTATGTNLKWYDAATAGTLLNASAALATGTYFVSQTLNSCESARTSVVVTINTTAAPTASDQSFTTASTVANLVPAPSSTLKWYNALTGGVALAANTPLATGNYFLAATNSNGCESARTTVAVAVNVVILPQVGDTFTANDINYIVTKATTPYEVSVNTNTNFVGAAVIPQTVANTGNTFNVTSFIELAFGGCTGLTSVTIPATITSIANGTFQGCTNLLSVTIPNSVTDLGDYSFSYCTALESITIPNSVTRINTQAFFACTSLINIVIPNSVTSIDSHAFIACTSLSSITIPNSVSSIGESAFESCSALTTITLPNALTDISTKLFSSCVALTSVLIPNSVTSIGDFAFEGCTALPSLTLPNSVISIGESAFSFCAALASIQLSNSLKTISESAFSPAGLVSLTIPNSVTNIGFGAFNGCSRLVSVEISTALTAIGNQVFSSCTSLKSVIIPNSVRNIEPGAFNRCTSLASVTIPNSVTTIGNGAFNRCTGLTSVTVNWLNPLVIDASIFFNVTLSNVTLNVPAGTLAAYQAAAIWKDFNPITAPNSNIIPSTMNFCAGTRVAAAVGTSTLKFYSALTGGSALAGTTTLATRTYFATQLVNGIESTPRVAVAITINTLPTTVTTVTASDAVLCKYIGTTNTVTYTATPGASSYSWTVPTGVTVVGGQETNILTVHFNTATPSGAGIIGNIGVRAVNASGCVSATARTIALSTKLPTAPSKVALTFNGVAQTRVGHFVGDASKALILEATDSSNTADSYTWELPAGVSVVSGNPLTDRIITIHLGGVIAGNTALVFKVSSVAGCGTSIARSLTVTRTAPATPTALALTNDAIASTTRITTVSAYTGKLNTTPLTLTATPSSTAGATATSYKWVLPSGIAIVDASAAFVSEDTGFTTYTSTSNAIKINLSGVGTATSMLLQVYGVNGNGESLLSRNLTLRSAIPAKPGRLTTASGSTATYHPTCGTITVNIPNVFGVAYAWSVKDGALATVASTNTDGNEATIDVSKLPTILRSSFKIGVVASNGTGSAETIYTINLGTACTSLQKKADDDMTKKVANAFKVIAYPNPSSNVFNIKIQSSENAKTDLTVYDSTGRLMEQVQVQTNEVDLGSRYPAGIYNLIVKQGENVKTIRIVKK